MDTEKETFIGSGEGGLPPTEKAAATVKTFLFALTSDRGARLIAFRISNILIGRLPDNHLSLNHTSVSRRHAKISVTGSGVLIEDMGSQNGTTVNGQVLKEPGPLRPGDIIRIGHVPLYYFGFIQMENPPVIELVENGIAINPLLPSVS